MKKQLTKKEKQRLRNYFGNELCHPLFLACDTVFTMRAARLEGVKADGEDIFREVAYLLDYLMGTREGELTQVRVNDLYTKVVSDVRDWEKSTPSDREIIADTVFRIVCNLMCHYWALWQSEKIYEMMRSTLEYEGHREEHNDFDNRLVTFSSALDTWINQEYDGHLSDEIIEAKKEKIVPIKKKSGRRAVDPKDITASFTYLPKQSDKTQRLQAFYNSLKRGFIDTKTDMREFVNLFMGVSMTDYIVWTKSVRELHYMIDFLTDRKWITIPQGYGKWLVVCARFRIRIKKKEVVDDSMTDDSFVIAHLSPNQFSKDSGVPTAHEELDKALRILNPKTDYEEALQEFLDEQERSEVEDVNDALAHGLQVRTRM